MNDFYELAVASRLAGGGGSPAPEPVLITKSVTANGTYNASSDSADGYSAVTVAVPPTFMLTPSVVNAAANFGSHGGKVAENLTITDEETLNTRMSGGWDSQYAATYDMEYQIGAYGGYKWDTPFVLSSAKFWIGKYVQQNQTLIITVQVRNANDEWVDVQDFNVSADIPYPVNVFECQLPSTPIYGVRWIHKKEPQKTSANTITFFGMKLYT